jgi:hypothetical protein
MYTEDFKDFSKINIEKLSSILISSGQIIIDSNLQKISIRTKEEIEKSEIIETCQCFIYFRKKEFEEHELFNPIKNINKHMCNNCNKVFKGYEHIVRNKINQFKIW